MKIRTGFVAVFCLFFGLNSTHAQTAPGAAQKPAATAPAPASSPPPGYDEAVDRAVAEYMAKRENADERLVYVNEAPQSAEFYARGRVTIVAANSDLERYLTDPPRDFFALTDAQQKAGPDIVERLMSVASFGPYTLFVEARPRAAAAR